MEKDLKEYITPPVLLVLFLLGISLMIVSPVLNMVILGAILAYAIRPLARKITSKIKIRSVSIFLAVILVMIPLVILIAYIISVISGVLSDVLVVNPSGFNLNLDTVINQMVNSLPADISSGIDTASINHLYPFYKGYWKCGAGLYCKLGQQTSFNFCRFIYFIRINILLYS